MRKIRETPYHSYWIGQLPRGCRLCVKGAKLVLLLTGLCARRCWYCPLSEQKKNRDVVVANEWWVSHEQDVLEEARLCDSLGAGFTGGDPLIVLNRTVRYLRLLKKNFGDGFHVHLYTPGSLASEKNLLKLYKAGLDEIRFHPTREKDYSGLENALKFSWDVGCEIPVIPGEGALIKTFINHINDLGVRFLNLNELELSESNANALSLRGFQVKSDVSYAVAGSQQLALKLMEYCARDTSLNVHYCTVKLKDGVQLPSRLKRRAKNAAKEYDIITREGLLVRGAMYLPELTPSFNYNKKIASIQTAARKNIIRRLDKTAEAIKEKFRLPSKYVVVDERRLRLLTGAWILEEIAGDVKSMGLKPAVVEEYPTWDTLCVDLKML